MWFLVLAMEQFLWNQLKLLQSTDAYAVDSVNTCRILMPNFSDYLPLVQFQAPNLRSRKEISNTSNYYRWRFSINNGVMRYEQARRNFKSTSLKNAWSCKYMASSRAAQTHSVAAESRSSRGADLASAHFLSLDDGSFRWSPLRLDHAD